MDFGIMIMPTDEGPDPVELAIRAEELGLESIFCPDHTHVPADRRTPFPNPPYGDLPREYYRFRDPFITLAGIASQTKTIKLGTSVSLVVARDPILMAKQVATLDLMSDGRVLLGVGAGWNREEMENHGTDPRTRMALLGERVQAMKEIWSNERAEYHGQFVDFDPLYSWPKPVQRPGPPVIVGGNGPKVLDRVLTYGDGWIPGIQHDMAGLAKRIEELQHRAATAGRPPIPVSLVYAKLQSVDLYAQIGVSRCVFAIPPYACLDDAVAQMADIASMTARFAKRDDQ